MVTAAPERSSLLPPATGGGDHDGMSGRRFDDDRQRSPDLSRLRSDIAALTATVVAPRGIVSVTVGNAGEVTGLSFPSAAYRSLTPTELATTITETIAAARDEVLDQVADLLAPMLPPTLDARRLLRGELEPPEEPPIAP